MATKTYLRFTIEADGHQRTVLSVGEKKNGTVLIRPKHDIFNRPPFQHPSGMAEPMRVRSQKYTVHPSRDSPENVNTIHTTTEREAAPPLEWRHLTKAIKNKAGFVLLNVRRCANLAMPHFVSTRSANETVTLGKYDPSLFTLYYALIVGAKNVPFNYDAKPDVGYTAKNQLNILEHVLEHSRLVVLWSFLAAPSHQTSLTFHNATVPATTPEEHRAMLGNTNAECVDIFARQCEILETEQRSFMMMEAGKRSGESATIPIERWFRDGLKNTGATERYVKGVTMRVATISI